MSNAFFKDELGKIRTIVEKAADKKMGRRQTTVIQKKFVETF